MAVLRERVVWTVPTYRNLDAAVRVAAERSHVSLSAYIRDAVATRLKADGVEPDAERQP